MNSTKYQHVTRRDYETVAGPDWPIYEQFQQHLAVPAFVYDEIDVMLSEPRTFDNQAFCVLPFFGMEVPQGCVCCLLPFDHDLDQIKKDMLAGVRPKACAKCWNLEDAGFKSDRQLKNETLDFYFDKDLSALFDQCLLGQNSTVHYKIDTSNTCNSTCITCNSYSSSLWAQLESRNGIKPRPNWSLEIQDVDADIDFARAQSVGFRGGEPLLSATNFEILERLIAHKNTDCFINFTTNGGVELTQRQKQILSAFSNINMGVSIDGVGSVFEYLRYPLKWQKVLDNIEHFRSQNMIVSANYTVSNLNVLYFQDTVDWFQSNNIKYLINPVYNPEHFSVKSLPQKIKNLLSQQVSDKNLLRLIGTHSPVDDKNYQQFIKEIQKQDTWKGISIKDYLPELYELLG